MGAFRGSGRLVSETATATVTIQNKLGLHIRPSRYLSSLAKSWDAVVTVRNQERTASADSQLDLLMLLASEGTTLEISATGPQAEEAVDSLVKLVNDRFGEDDPSFVLAPLDTAPFFGAEVSLGDIGTCGGPRVNAKAQVLDPFGNWITGLYASGNNAGIGSPGASYGGGGGTIGPALTFAFVAGSELGRSKRGA